ncbi:class I SAM-dependent DNA methyltransferase [Sagittula salina]|uniref:Class I SAM-dependent methyltransferase n=1 Tax=Sagittula salina TaxID=2820268 RepID=A0A940RZZ0_9RHOB|nr:class I SAM-dependent methyltransferase [Sagittula salina]MBP0481502.1 class I SAM-dependent methyltransferase [Sagittula salina]
MVQDLEAAYALQTPDDNLKLYRDWAESYDTGFARDMDYILPRHVAELFRALGGAAPVLDMGAGTGLCGAALTALGIGPVEATDLSQDMLDVSAGKGVYARLFTGNLLERLPVEDGAYAGVTCSGTFTHGHVGPEALPEVLRVLRPGGLAVISVHAEHWRAKGFAAAVDGLDLSETGWREVAIFGEGATGDHARDKSRILWLRKR